MTILSGIFVVLVLAAVGSMARRVARLEADNAAIRRRLNTLEREADRRDMRALADRAAIERLAGWLEATRSDNAAHLAQLDGSGDDNARWLGALMTRVAALEWHGELVGAAAVN